MSDAIAINVTFPPPQKLRIDYRIIQDGDPTIIECVQNGSTLTVAEEDAKSTLKMLRGQSQ